MRRGCIGRDEEVELGYQPSQRGTLECISSSRKTREQTRDNELTLNLYFVSTPSYTLFTETFSNVIVKAVGDRM